MRYGVIPGSLRERRGLLAGKVPLPIIDCLAPLVQARALMAAVHFGVFEALADGAHDAPELGRRLGLNGDALDMLLRLLVSMRYLDIETGHYRVAKLGRRTLLAGAPLDMRAYVEANFIQWKLVENLEDVLRTGRGIDLHETAFSAAEWETYQRAMLGLARTTAATIARLMPVPSGRSGCSTLAGVTVFSERPSAGVTPRCVRRSWISGPPWSRRGAWPGKPASTTWWITARGTCSPINSHPRERTSCCSRTSSITSHPNRMWNSCVGRAE